jgi:hypothetical protein
MKKLKIISLVAIVAICMASLFYACSKNNSDPITPDRSSASNAGTPSPTLVSRETYYSAITQTHQAKMIVDLMSDNTYDVYVSTEPVNEESAVAAYFPGLEVEGNEEDGTVEVTMTAGDHTFIVAHDPANPIDYSVPTLGVTVYTCTCCGNAGGTGCKAVPVIYPAGAKCALEGNICPAPADHSIQCQLNKDGISTGGGVMISASMDKIRVHQN